MDETIQGQPQGGIPSSPIPEMATPTPEMPIPDMAPPSTPVTPDVTPTPEMPIPDMAPSSTPEIPTPTIVQSEGKKKQPILIYAMVTIIVILLGVAIYMLFIQEGGQFTKHQETETKEDNNTGGLVVIEEETPQE